MKKIMGFLQDLQVNNNREWFHEHKKERMEATEEFYKLINEIILEIQSFDSAIPMMDAKDLTFKMVRDTRFSNDKSPYNPSFRAHIAPHGKLPIPVGYFINLQPNGNSMIGGGLFADMFKDATEMIRQEIDVHGDEFEHILHEKEFSDHFVLLGTKLKNVPKNYPKDHPYGDYLKYKSWFVEYHYEDQDLIDEQVFIKKTIELCKSMKTFNDFLNKALVNFKMPQR